MTTELPQPKFKIGDVVQLNSGGPLMTVADNDDPKNIDCQFFGGVDTISYSFHQDCLHIVEVGPNPPIS